MFGTHDLALFALAVLVVNATPGVDMALTLLSTLKGGIRTGLAAAAGICAGCVVHTLAAAFGLAALMATSAAAFNLIKWAGAAYLLWLAVGMWRSGLGRPPRATQRPWVPQPPSAAAS
jgi:threonine/homoserine/homoserine lactone efflux protein